MRGNVTLFSLCAMVFEISTIATFCTLFCKVQRTLREAACLRWQPILKLLSCTEIRVLWTRTTRHLRDLFQNNQLCLAIFAHLSLPPASRLLPDPRELASVTSRGSSRSSVTLRLSSRTRKGDREEREERSDRLAETLEQPEEEKRAEQGATTKTGEIFDEGLILDNVA